MTKGTTRRSKRTDKREGKEGQTLALPLPAAAAPRTHIYILGGRKDLVTDRGTDGRTDGRAGGRTDRHRNAF